MDNVYSTADEECLLLAYYFGRTKLLNCVALQRITQDLLKSFESPPDNRTTKYSEPLDGCCLCEEKENLFKDLLKKHVFASQSEKCEAACRKGVEKAWTEVSEFWSNVMTTEENLSDTLSNREVCKVSLDLIKKHGLTIFSGKKCHREDFQHDWEALKKILKRKLQLCFNSIARINGDAVIPTNAGPNISKWTMRNCYLFLVKRKAARQHAKFMQTCREVGIQIRAARDPASVIAKYTMCKMCAKRGDRYKVLEVTNLLMTAASYLDTVVSIDEYPDTEPIFGEDKNWLTIGKALQKSDPARQGWLPLGIETSPIKNGSVTANVRRSDRVPAIKKKNESFLYYANGGFSSSESAASNPAKKRRASLPVATAIAPQDAMGSPKPQTMKPDPGDDNMNVVIVTAEGGRLGTTLSPTTNSYGANSSSPGNKLKGPDQAPLKIVPCSRAPPSVGLGQKGPFLPVKVSASKCGVDTVKKLPPQRVNPTNKTQVDILKTVMQSLIPAKNQQLQSGQGGCNGPKPQENTKVIPITPSSLAQLINSKKSQRVIFFPANSTDKAIELKKPTVIPLKLTPVANPVSRSRSISLDSGHPGQVVFQSIKPKTLVTAAPVPITSVPAKTPTKSPLFVQIVNGKIQNLKDQQAGSKTSPNSMIKPIPLSATHVKFVKSVSLKNQPGLMKNGSEGRKSDTSTGSSTVEKTLVLGGNLKQGSIMRVGPPSVKTLTVTQPQFQLGKSFTFKTALQDKTLSVTEGTRTISALKLAKNSPKKFSFTNVPSPYESQCTNYQASAGSLTPKKVSTALSNSPVRTPGKKRHVRPPSKSMATVVAEHIFSLMSPSADNDLFKKLNAKNKRRSEKSSALIPVPYETNYLCIYDTIERIGWKAYWYRKCRCSKIREKATETDLEYSEPNATDLATWVPKKLTEAMKRTLNEYLESEERIFSSGMIGLVSHTKEKMSPAVKLLLEDYQPMSEDHGDESVQEMKCDNMTQQDHEDDNVQEIKCYGMSQQDHKDESVREMKRDCFDESDNIDVETVEESPIATDARSNLKRKSSDVSPEQPKKVPTLGIIAKYRKDKNGNWTALSNLCSSKVSPKHDNHEETTSQSDVESNSRDCSEDQEEEDSVMLNIHPGLNSSPASSSPLSMEDCIGTTNDHGLRRCARVTMIRRKALVRRAFDAEMKFKNKREKAETSASDIFLCTSFRYGSLTDPNFSVVTAHPTCYRDEPELCCKVSSVRDERSKSRRELLQAIEEVENSHLAQPSNADDSFMSILTSPITPDVQHKMKRNQEKNPTPVAPKTKISNAEEDKADDVWERTKNVVVKSKKISISEAPALSSPGGTSQAGMMSQSDRRCKVVNQITERVALNNLQVLRGVPEIHPPTNIITRCNAEFALKALKGWKYKEQDLNPVVVLGSPSLECFPKTEVKVKLEASPPVEENPESPPAESLPSWMLNSMNTSTKLKSSKSKIRSAATTSPPSSCSKSGSTTRKIHGAAKPTGQCERKLDSSTRDSKKAVVNSSGFCNKNTTSASQADTAVARPPRDCLADVVPVLERVRLAFESDKLGQKADIESNASPLDNAHGLGCDTHDAKIRDITSGSENSRRNGGKLDLEISNRDDRDCSGCRSTASLSPGLIASKRETYNSVGQEEGASEFAKNADSSAAIPTDKSSVAPEREHSTASGNHLPPNVGSGIGQVGDRENVIISDAGLDEASPVNSVDFEKLRERSNVLESVDNKMPDEPKGFKSATKQVKLPDAQGPRSPCLKMSENFAPHELKCAKHLKASDIHKTRSPGDKKTANFVPSLFTIRRDLRSMMKMSKRGSLAHLSLSRSKEDSIPFKKHLRKRFKANRNLLSLLSHSYDLKRIFNQFKDEVKDSKKSVPGKERGKTVKFNRKKSGRKQPLSNMLNWIWDANDSETVKLAKYIPAPSNAQNPSLKHSVSCESTPETTRGPLFSKLSCSSARIKDLLVGDVGICRSPQTDDGAPSSEVSEVQLTEPSSSTTTPTSLKQQRKRRREGSHSLDGMYWTDLPDYNGNDRQPGKNLRRRRILAEEPPDEQKVQVNKRKRPGNGLRMSDFEHARDIIKADKASVKRYNRERSNVDWEEEDTVRLDPFRSLFCRSLNIDRVRSWIWDSTSPRPLHFRVDEGTNGRRRSKNARRHRLASFRVATSTANSSYSQIISKCSEASDDKTRGGCVYNSSSEASSLEAERYSIPLIRCSVRQEDFDSDSETVEKRLFLVRRAEKGSKNSENSRPLGLSKHRGTKSAQKIDFPALFEKINNSRLLQNGPNGKDVPATSETEVEVDVGEKSESTFRGDAVDSVNASYFGPPREDDIVIDSALPKKKLRPSSQKNKKRVVSAENEAPENQERKRKKCDSKPEDGGKTKLQALRETVFLELKQKGSFQEQKTTTPDISSGASSGGERRRPLLQSRCSTKGSFISRLLEFDSECPLSNDVIKT